MLSSTAYDAGTDEEAEAIGLSIPSAKLEGGAMGGDGDKAEV